MSNDSPSNIAKAILRHHPRAWPDAAEIDDPRREIRLGVVIAVLFFIGFLGWAALARMDAAAYAPGQLIVSGQRQAVQHRDGGLVGEILVEEGDKVERGQVLMRLAAAEVRAQERSLAAQTIGLMAQRARLQAEQLGSVVISTPAEFATLQGEDRATAAEALRLQQTQRRTRASLLATQRGVIGQQSAQALQEGEGYRRQGASADEQARLITEELESLLPLAEKGFVPKNRILELKRAKAELEGRGGQNAATLARSQEAVIQGQLQIVEAERSHQERIASERREVEAALLDLQPKLRAARDQLARTEIRAPTGGTVVGLTVFTAGGVIAPGQTLMDIVPARMPLVIEAKINPADADDLSVGQLTRVRFSSLHERTLPDLEGSLTLLSADSFEDERTGLSFFRAEVRVPREQLDLIQQRRGDDFALRAGMPVEVLFPLRKRTALQYAFEPLSGAFWRAFREQ